jgi:hypothetical protein
LTDDGELLAYVNFFRHRSTTDALRNVLLNFYSSAEIAESKKVLLATFSSRLPTDCPLRAKRVKSAVRQAHEVEVDDILGIFNILDDMTALDGIVFTAAAIDRLPGVYSPEAINMCSLIDRQNHTEAMIANLTASIASTTTAAGSDGVSCLNGITEAIGKMDDKLQKVSQGLQGQIDLLTATCGKLVESLQSAAVHSEETKKSRDEADRAMNIVISGIKENRDTSLWRDEAALALRAAAGKDVEIVDAFRLGRFLAGKTRPVLVKLRSIWDRRLVLSGRRKLAESADFRRRVYISPDESLEARRRSTLQRLVRKAEGDHKKFDVHDGILTINDVTVFSMKDGFLQSNVRSASTSSDA